MNLEIECFDPAHTYKTEERNIFPGGANIYLVYQRDPVFLNGGAQLLGLLENRGTDGYYFVPSGSVPNRVVDVRVDEDIFSRLAHHHSGASKGVKKIKPNESVKIYVEPHDYSTGDEKKAGKALWAKLRLVNGHNMKNS